MSESNEAASAVETPEIEAIETSEAGSDLENDSLNPFSEVESDEQDESLEEDEEFEEELSASEKKEVEKEIKRLKKLKLKYNGREYEEELPFEIDDNPEIVEYLTRQLQMAKMGQHKSQEFAMLQNDVRDFVSQLRDNPLETLSDPSLGLDLKELAARVVEEELENAQKSPEQLEKERLEKELNRMKEEREREQEEFRRREMERLQQEQYERYDMLMDQALNGSDLPKTPYVVKKMADYMIMAINKGYDVEPSDILPIVREEILSDIKSMSSVMEPDQLLNLWGNDSYERIRKHRLSKNRKKKATEATKKKATDVGATKAKEEKKSDGEVKTFKDFFGV